MFKSSDLYIDLGTANTLIYAKGRGFLLNEPSVIAFKSKATNHTELFGLGSPAKQMIGKTPDNILVKRPLKEGVIADFESTSKMLHSFINRVRKNIFLLKPRMIISLPCEVTKFEKRAVEEVGYNLGASRVELLDEPMATAIGSGLPVLGHKSQMIIDIGGGTTEIALIALGGIIESTAIRVGGNTIDSEIVDHLRNKHGFLIGEPTAERLKIQIASLSKINKEMSVGGIDLLTGLPRRLNVSSAMIYEPVFKVISQITVSIKKTLEKSPPEVSSDLLKEGAVIAGGGAMLNGLNEWFQRELNIPIKLANDPLLSVAYGGARALESAKLFDSLQNPA